MKRKQHPQPRGFKKEQDHKNGVHSFADDDEYTIQQRSASAASIWTLFHAISPSFMQSVHQSTILSIYLSLS